MFALSMRMRNVSAVVLFSGILIGILVMGESAFSATDPSSSATQDPLGSTPDSAGSLGKEGAAKGSHSMKTACAADVKQLCPDIKAGEGRIAHCLKEHRQDLSQGCIDAIQQRGKRRR